VARIIWNGFVDNWHEGDHLAKASLKAGLQPVRLFSGADHDGERLAQIVKANQNAQRGAGHYGVPLMAFNGGPFFGQDRFDQFKWRLSQHGLKRRGAVGVFQSYLELET
jgi:2-hydroxychromene-2-carboxylate isomerase